MKARLLNLGLILTSLIGYLEWGGGNSRFLVQVEGELLSILVRDALAAVHPLTVLPLVGQLLLLVTLVQTRPSTRLTYLGMAGLSMLLGLMLVIGLMTLNVYITASTVPFFVVAWLTVRHHRARRRAASIPSIPAI
jgi:hypothetical protein